MADAPGDLEITRFVAAPRAKVWRAWSEPELLKRWWCPRPWTTEVRAFDFRPGGGFHTHMSGPDGGESDNPGLFLEIAPMERIVWTSMLVAGWRPAQPWLAMTGIFTMADEGAGTRYTARCLHRDDADRRRHEEMGFFDGWGAVIGQLEELAASL
ncbi:MAG: SRPBCC family protein [Rhodospirillales bacterium]|nr:MAG: SRPBCC family protein [Rhodospirillales bacterium]